MAKQAIEDDAARVDGDDIGAIFVRDEVCRLGQRYEAVVDDFCVLARRSEIGGQPQVVDENRFALRRGLPPDCACIRIDPGPAIVVSLLCGNASMAPASVISDSRSSTR